MTYEEPEVKAALLHALRAQAQAELVVLEMTCDRFEESLSAGERLVLAAAVGEIRRVLRDKQEQPQDAERDAKIEREYLDRSGRGSNVVHLPHRIAAVLSQDSFPKEGA